MWLATSALAQDKPDQAAKSMASLSDSLNMLIKLADTTWNANDSANLQSMSGEGSYPVRALATALLFRNDPKAYFDRFVSIYAIHDYKPRSEGIENLSSQAEMLEQFTEVQAEYPEVEDSRLKVLLMYDHVRDANVWVEIRGRKLSTSRFFRATFLSDLFQDSSVDIEKVQASIDDYTRAQDLEGQ